MKIIAHRGNVNGPNPEIENKPEYIDVAIGLGFDAEIDVWKLEEGWFLGHEKPSWITSANFLSNRRFVLWCHAKNFEALVGLKQLKMNCFFHDSDLLTLTSEGYIWSLDGSNLWNSGSVLVRLEQTSFDWSTEQKPYAICTDYPKAAYCSTHRNQHGKPGILYRHC